MRHDRGFVARESGTGLADDATPVGRPVLIVTTQLNRIVEVDPSARVAWVEPGVLNLDLSRAVRHLGLHYAPDPSSQVACTIGGNVATIAGARTASRRGSPCARPRSRRSHPKSRSRAHRVVEHVGAFGVDEVHRALDQASGFEERVLLVAQHVDECVAGAVDVNPDISVGAG